MSKQNRYTIKKYKSKGGAEKKKAKTTRQARRTPKEKNEDFMRVLHKTYNRLRGIASYKREGEDKGVKEFIWLLDTRKKK